MGEDGEPQIPLLRSPGFLLNLVFHELNKLWRTRDRVRRRTSGAKALFSIIYGTTKVVP